MHKFLSCGKTLSGYIQVRGVNKETMEELLALALLPKHENILNFFGIMNRSDGISEQKKVCFLTAYCEKGSLDQLHVVVDMTSKLRFKVTIKLRKFLLMH